MEKKNCKYLRMKIYSSLLLKHLPVQNFLSFMNSYEDHRCWLIQSMGLGDVLGPHAQLHCCFLLLHGVPIGVEIPAILISLSIVS
jgi:hypothetical protein